MLQLVHQLDLFQHVGPVGTVLVHLQHHHLPCHLQIKVDDILIRKMIIFVISNILTLLSSYPRQISMRSLYLKPHPVGDFEHLTEEPHPKLFHVKVVHPEKQY